MKVLHVITGLDPGGAESMLSALLTAARPEPPKQRVVSLTPGGALRPQLAGRGIVVSDLGMAPGRPSAAALVRLAGIIRGERPDAVQGWMYHADLLATLALLASGRRSRTRLFWGVRCSNMDTASYPRRLRLVIAACARLSRLPDAVTANSVAGKEHHRRLGYRPRRFPVIANGIDTERFRPDPEARRVVRGELGLADDRVTLVHPARLDPMKDHPTLLAALARLPQVTALAVGAGTERLPEMPNLIRLGRRLDMPRIYAAGDLVVSSSAFGEGFSNALAEGMAAGLPAVATGVGDAQAIVGDCGRVVPPRRPEALASALANLLGADRSALGRRARSRIVERFSLERAVAAFDALHRGEEGEPCAA